MTHNLSSKTRLALRRAGMGFCFALSVTAAFAAAPATVEGTYGTVTIGDLPGMVDRVGTLASKINPGLNGDTIKAQAGMMLGDAGLSSIPSGSGLVLALPVDGKPFLLVETAEGKAETLVKTLKERGMQAEAVNGKLMALAADASSLEAAKGATGTAVAAQLSGNDDKFITVTLDSDKLVADKGSDIKGFLDKMATQAADKGSSNAQGTFKFIGNMITSIGKRTDVGTLKIDISSEGIQFEKTIYPVGGSTGAGKPEGPSGAELAKSVPSSGDALGRYEGYMDMQWVVKGISALLSESMEGTGISQADKDSLNSLLALSGEGFGDGFAGWVNMSKDGSNGIYLLTVNNEAKAMQYLEDGVKQASSGALHNFYSSMGMETSTTLTKNAGTVDGQPFHAFSMSLSNPSMEKNPMLGMSNVQGKVTVVGGNKMIVALGDANLEEAVKAAKAGSASSAKAVTAATALPAGGAFYVDYDAGALGDTLGAASADIGKFLSTLKGNPIHEAAYINDDSVKFIMHIPGDLITKAVSGIQQGMASKQVESDNDKPTSTEDSSAPKSE